jgi:UDP-N-acetylglucosamine--N-acetylmuramyl-(pentapeptide) pyrophosphoryl-undecaprenol N-acetylglucosamine transferase
VAILRATGRATVTEDEVARPKAKRIVIAGGGTGGHLMPALALARELVARGAEVLLIGAPRGPDREILPASGLPYRILDAPALERRRWWRNARVPLALAMAVARARGVVGAFRPDVAVGTGGYVMVPALLAARMRGVPILLQEQNRVPGVATRFLSRWARAICVQFEEAVNALGGRGRVEVTGSPIAPPVPVPADFAARIDGERRTLGAFGGSQGARALNDAVIGMLGADPAAAPFNLVWQTGVADHARIRVTSWPARFVIRPFFSPMQAVYPLLDLIVCRAGAMTLAEVTAWGIPSILVPYPLATADHQMLNARALEKAGAAVVIPQSELVADRLQRAVADLLGDPIRRRAMAEAARRLGRPEATARVADRVLELAGRAA